jgi:DNA-binding transcriptional ArsR family regulator
MVEPLSLVAVADALSQPSRAAACVALLDRRAKTAGELARIVGVTPQTMSDHLAQLVHAGLLVVERHGRQRYFCLASTRVADLLESFSEIGAMREKLRPVAPRAPAELRHARMCYDHLAGQCGVALRNALERAGRIERRGTEYLVTAEGERWLRTVPIDPDQLRKSRRTLARCCLDWSERQPHIGGALGAALFDELVARGGVRRKQGTRALDAEPTAELIALLDACRS